jgi:hypothetical protein
MFSTPAEQMNFTVYITDDALWSGLEITLGIINACLPVMQPAAQRIFNIRILRLITFSSIRSPRGSRGTGTSRFASWRRLGSTKDDSKAGIERAVEYSVDIESESGHRIPLENMGSTTKLATQSQSSHPNPLTNTYEPRS